MDKSSVLKLAKQLTVEHGFENVPVVFSRTKKSLGRAWWLGGLPVKIDLSSHWMEHLPESEVRDTILHEIAHFIAGPKAGHGPAWVRACLRVGARPSRTSQLPSSLQQAISEKISKYKATCGKCSNVVLFDRMTRNWRYDRYACSCGGRFKVEGCV